MKYCPRCKIRVSADATACHKCGGVLRRVGDGPPAEGGAPADSAEPALALQLQGLEHDVRRSRATLRLFGALALLASSLFVALLVGLHFYDVMQYAEVTELTVQSMEGRPGEAEITFIRRNAGIVEFVREMAGLRETLIDHGRQVAGDAGEQKFSWSGGSESDDYTIRARVRDGWSTAEKVWLARNGKIEPAP
jgi:hypothetical protein